MHMALCKATVLRGKKRAQRFQSEAGRQADEKDAISFDMRDSTTRELK